MARAMTSFRGKFWLPLDLYLVYFDWKVKRFCWPKGTSLECEELIYVKTMETACELCCFKEEEEDGQIMSLDDSRIERVRDRLASLNLLTVSGPGV